MNEDQRFRKAQILNDVVQRWRNGQSIRSISREVGLSRYAVARLLAAHQRGSQSAASDASTSLGCPPRPRASKLDAYEPQLKQLLERYPRITAKRLLEELQRAGYDGRYSILRVRVKQLRESRPPRLTVRFETAPGAQAQMDWSTYEISFTQEGKRHVQLFSYILGYSRRQYLQFTERQDFETTLRQHVAAFEHLGGVAATCLYDNMKVVVTHWEDGQPVYNTRFLAFATHYGYRPWACLARRPQTKGKVERPFHYVETNLLNGREFRSLAHLNEVARWWLLEVADRRTHGTTGKTPLELHAEELPHLLPLPMLRFDTAQVVYRFVEEDGTIRHRNNHYSVPWQHLGQRLPVRVTEDELLVYNQSLSLVARHPLLPDASGQTRKDPAHAPPRDLEEQLAQLRARYAELGPVGSQFLEGLLKKQRYGKHDARRVLTLLHAYSQADLVAAMQRAIQYHAHGYSSLERILSHQGTPKPTWQALSDREQAALQQLTDSECVNSRRSEEYQHLLEPPSPDQPLTKDQIHESEGAPEANTDRARQEPRPAERPFGDEPARPDPTASPDTPDPDDGGPNGRNRSGGHGK